MLKVYYLRQLKDEASNTEYIEGQDLISNAICETTEKPDVYRVIVEENPNLARLALKVEEPTEQDLENYNSLLQPSPPPRNLEQEIDDLKARIEKLEKRGL